MSRRYLALSEAESALQRGKTVECFIGPCERGGARGVKWLAASLRGKIYRMNIYETADHGNERHLDLYEFGPLDPALELDQPDHTKVFDNFQTLIAEMETVFPGSSAKLVNEGVIQDEYSDFIARGRT